MHLGCCSPIDAKAIFVNFCYHFCTATVEIDTKCLSGTCAQHGNVWYFMIFRCVTGFSYSVIFFCDSYILFMGGNAETVTVGKGNILDLSELFNPATFRATAASLVYVLLYSATLYMWKIC